MLFSEAAHTQVLGWQGGGKCLVVLHPHHHLLLHRQFGRWVEEMMMVRVWSISVTELITSVFRIFVERMTLWMTNKHINQIWNKQTRTNIATPSSTQTHANKHTHIHTNVHPNKHTPKQTHTQTNTHPNKHTPKQTNTQKNKQTKPMKALSFHVRPHSLLDH